MTVIHLGDEQIPVSQSPTKLLGFQTWGFDWNELSFDVGGERGPDKTSLELARRVAANFEPFVMAANEYLSAMVSLERFNATLPWIAQGFEFGIYREDSFTEFEVCLVIDGDTYGLWHVRFRDVGPPVGFWPVAFSRQQH